MRLRDSICKRVHVSLTMATTMTDLRYLRDRPHTYQNVMLFDGLQVSQAGSSSFSLHMSPGLRCIIWEAWRRHAGDEGESSVLTICEAHFLPVPMMNAVYLEAKVVVNGNYLEPEHIVKCEIYQRDDLEFKRFLLEF